ncbi:hypothetical protein [Streptomyces sp. L2]|uniref:hypothetical protein n=1 Tax=Streptomyces sp. L2 TaxID=2162665 RepID=UPI001012235A|nr:hypothetical protein [Streptomyces sp. L2]
MRTAAVARIQDDSASLAPGFRAWVNDGGRWPLEHDGQLATAFKLQPAASQCLLWHAAVERDDAVSITRITGHPYRHLGELGDKARDSLRRTRMDVYLQRLERRPCRYAIGSLVAHGRVTSSPLMRPSPHFVDCLSCREVYYDVVDLDRRLQQRLPRSTLGWWPAEEYLRIKWATSPLRDPPAAAPRPAPGRHRKPARLPARLLPAGVLDGLATSLDGLATRKGTR